MIKNKFNFIIFIISSRISLILGLILCQIFLIFGEISAQEYFQRDTPDAFLSISLRPDVVVFGDITNNGHDDIIFAESGRNPQFLFYHPDSNGYYRPVHENFLQANGNTRNLPNGIVSDFGSIAILDISGDGNNDVAFFSSAFGTQAFIATWQDTIMAQIPSTDGLGNVSFRGTSGVQFGDINGDGKLDMHMTSQSAQNIRNWLVYNIFNQNNDSYLNDGDDESVQISAATRSNYLYDFNLDGHLDLYVNNGNNQQDEFYRGTGSGFNELAGHILTGITNSMGSAIGDFNNNGLPDIYRTQVSNTRNTLFVNQGDLEFTRGMTDNVITLENRDSRNATWADIDNNGWLDLTVAESGASVSLYKNEAATTFRKLSDEQVMNFTGDWRHIIFFDLDNNGKLDLLTTGKQNNNAVTVYRNIAPDNNWVGFTLEQTNAYYSEAFGARLRLTANINGETLTQTRFHNPFHGRFTQHPSRIHFGLADASSAELEITWPSGQVTTHSLGVSEINSYLEFTEPQAGKLNQVSEGVNLVASLRDEVRDTLYFENIGLDAIQISDVVSPRAHVHVEEFSHMVGVHQEGYIAIRYSPTEFEDLQVRSDSVFIISDAIQTRFPITFTTDGRTNPAEFSLASSDTVSIFNRSAGHQKTIWADFTGNDLQDVIQIIEDENNRLYFQTDSGVFEYQQQSIISLEGRFVSSGTVGDYNRNGHIDVFLTSPDRENYFYKNMGNGSFERILVDGISGRTRNSTSASFYDFTKNGYLDLFITNQASQTNELLIYKNDSTYTPVRAGELSTRNNYAISHLIKDLDGDGYPEIIITNRAQTGSESFVDVYKGGENFDYNRIQIPGLTDAPFQARGVMSADFNNDGLPDLFFLNDFGSLPMRMYLNTGEMNFERINQEFFSNITSSPSDAVFVDYNLNGYTDIIITDSQFSNPNILLESVDGHNFIRINAGDFVTRADRASLGVAAIGYHQNGRQDIFISNYFNNNELYQNDVSENNWLTIMPLLESNSDKAPIMLPDTKVEVTATIDGTERTQTRWTGSEYLFSPVYGPLYFGLGDATTASIRLTYPDGTEETRTVDEINTALQVAVITSAHRDETENLPEKLSLHQNYPNPFNPVTTISFDLPADMNVRLRIYNALGQQVRELDNGHKSAGIHSVVFDATQLSSGLYFAVLETPDQRLVRKMTFVK